MSITLPNELAEAARAKVASGEDFTEREISRDGLRTLIARDCAAEQWLHEQVVSSRGAMAARTGLPAPHFTPLRIR